MSPKNKNPRDRARRRQEVLDVKYLPLDEQQRQGEHRLHERNEREDRISRPLADGSGFEVLTIVQ